MRFLRQWLPVVLWIALILSASNDTFSAAQSGGWFHRLIGFDAPELLHILIRKAAHITEYGVLAYLAWRASRTTTLPMVIVLIVSTSDEWLQSRSTTRTGTVWDVLLDVCAAVIVLVIVRKAAAALPPHSSTIIPPPC